MRLTSYLLLTCFIFSSLSLGCGFCSGKPKALSEGNPTQDPGASAVRPAQVRTVGGQEANAQRGGNKFSYDLQNYKADGQPSSDANWNSGDFFNSR